MINKTRNIKSLGEKECILCTTQEECDIIMDMMHDAGLKWCTWLSYKSRRIGYSDTWICYFPKKWTRDYYKLVEWCTIYPASDFIEKKRQPKQGERVLVRDIDTEYREERIFLCEIPQSELPYACVCVGQESDYLEWNKVGYRTRCQIKQSISEVKSTYTLELTEEQYSKVQDLINW